MASWLIGSLVGWAVGWLKERLVGCQFGEGLGGLAEFSSQNSNEVCTIHLPISYPFFPFFFCLVLSIPFFSFFSSFTFFITSYPTILPSFPFSPALMLSFPPFPFLPFLKESFPSFPPGRVHQRECPRKKARARKKSKRGKIDATLMLKKEEEKGTNYSELLTCWPVCLSVCLFVCLLRPSICWHILLIWYFHNRRGDSKSFATIFSLPKLFCIFFFFLLSLFFSLFSSTPCLLVCLSIPLFGCPLFPSFRLSLFVSLFYSFFLFVAFFFSFWPFFYDFVSEDRLIFPVARNFPGQKRPRGIPARPRDGRARS